MQWKLGGSHNTETSGKVEVVWIASEFGFCSFGKG